MVKTSVAQPVSVHEAAAWLLMAFALFFVVKFGLLPAVISGLLVYQLVHLMTPLISKRFPKKRTGSWAKLMAVGLLVLIIVGLLVFAGVGLAALGRSDSGGLNLLLAKMAEILEDSRKILPMWLVKHVPADAIAFQELITVWLRNHADQLQVVGKEAGRVIVHVIIGMIIGGMLALREAVTIDHFKPFARTLAGRGSMFSDAFRRVVFAQIRISALNTFFTAVYLGVVLPMAGIHLPFVKTMIAITFIVGLIPVAGNLGDCGGEYEPITHGGHCIAGLFGDNS